MGTSPIHRPLIPSINPNRHIKEWLQILNEIIENFLAEDQDFQQTHLAIYCAAITVAEMQQVQLKPCHGGPRNTNHKLNRKPQWQIRLERNIMKLQKMIGQITGFMMGLQSEAYEQHMPCI
jgi:hypothetical protein